MRGILIRWLVLTLSIMLTAYPLEGIYVAGFFSTLFAAALCLRVSGSDQAMLLIFEEFCREYRSFQALTG
jgi:uncharacterized membrane protein YvlD (DUF360 family)